MQARTNGRRGAATTALAAALGLWSLAACGGDEGFQGDNYDYRSEGALIYAEQCASCHGEAGQGGLAMPLVDGDYEIDALGHLIDESMPSGDPARCTGECAESVAEFVVNGLRSDALSCNRGIQPSPRRLRLLTRREYRNTVRDLVDRVAPASCESALSCDYRQRCDDGVCLSESCGTHTFVFDAGDRQLGSVHVAGEFNGWAASVADGGYALVNQGNNVWTAQVAVSEGSYQYKFVLDGSDWVNDPRASEFADDGFGGQNSVLSLSCSGGGGFDPARAFPPEVRPDGFAFETHADSALVSSVHAESHIEAAEELSADLAQRMTGSSGCTDVDSCASELIDELAPRIFRRPLRGAERDGLRSIIESAETLEEGLETATLALFISPSFLYRSEMGGSAKGGVYRLTPHELASALSYTFWGTMPDDELWELAKSGELEDEAVMEEQVRRLLADPRSATAIETFAAQWLGAESIVSVDKNAGLFPSFGESLRREMLAETKSFVSHVIRSGSGKLGELFTADYSVVGPELASFYGGEVDAQGRMQHRDGRRAGILGHAAILSTNAHSDQTSPIRRGLFVRRRLLCHELPPPPPFAGAVPEIDPNATTRDRFAMHSSNEVCAGCHKLIDGIGFGFESFDPIGQYRSEEGGLPIDSTGHIEDADFVGSGTLAEFASLPELGAALSESDAAKSCFVRQYFRYVRGYREGLADRCARQWLEERFEDSELDMEELLVDMVMSPDFVERR